MESDRRGHANAVAMKREDSDGDELFRQSRGVDLRVTRTLLQNQDRRTPHPMFDNYRPNNLREDAIVPSLSNPWSERRFFKMALRRDLLEESILRKIPWVWEQEVSPSMKLKTQREIGATTILWRECPRTCIIPRLNLPAILAWEKTRQQSHKKSTSLNQKWCTQ